MKQKYIFIIISIIFMLYPIKVEASTNTASSYVLMDMNTGRILSSKNESSINI